MSLGCKMLLVLAGDQENVCLLQRSAHEVPTRVREFPPKADPKLDLSLPFMSCSQSQGMYKLLCQAIANCCWALRHASRNKLMKAATACCGRFTRCPLRYVRTRESFSANVHTVLARCLSHSARLWHRMCKEGLANSNCRTACPLLLVCCTASLSCMSLRCRTSPASPVFCFWANQICRQCILSS